MDRSEIMDEDMDNESIMKKVKSRVSNILPNVAGWLSPTVKNNGSVRRRRESDSEDDGEHEEELVQDPPQSKRRKSEISDGPGPSNQFLSSTRRSFGNSSPYNFQAKNPSMSIIASPIATNINDDESTDDEIGPLPQVKHETQFNVLRMNNSSDRSISEPPVAPAQQHVTNGIVSETESVEAAPTTSRLSGFLGNSSKKFRASTGELSLQQASSQNSLARHTFNPSLYGSSWSLNSGGGGSGGARFHRTISPFYGGRTIYGGASAYSRRDQRFQQTLRVPVQIRPSSSLSNSSSNTSIPETPGISNTSRRIMDLLNSFTSPLEDARRMGTGLNTSVKVPTLLQNKSRFNEDDLNVSRSVRLQQPKPYSRPAGPPVNELQVPTISQQLHMKRLQSSTEQVRKTAVHSKSTLNDVREYQLPVHTTNKPAEQNGELKQPSRVAKSVKSIQTRGHDKIESSELGPTLKLPDVKLPLTSVPKIDLPPSMSVPAQQVKPTKIVIIDNKKYTFSAPVPIKDSLATVSSSERNFKFSEPLNAKPLNVLNVQKKKQEAPAEPPQLKQGSCLDALFGSKKSNEEDDLFKKLVAKQKANKWECPGCMILNDANKAKCVSCAGPKPGTNAAAAPPPPVDSLFKQIAAKNSKKWECPMCMIQNQEENGKCVACESPKPGTGNKAPPAADQLFKKIAAQSSKKWECPMCMIQNSEEQSKCVACETAKPGGNKVTSASAPKLSTTDAGFKSLVAKQSAKWECSICLVQNDSNRTKCAACEAVKPGAAAVEGVALSFKGSAGKYQFGVPATSTTMSFGIPASSSFAVSTPSSVSTAPPAGITFGIPKSTSFASTTTAASTTTTTTQAPKTTTGITFGIPSGGINFGVTQKSKDEPDTKAVPVTTSGFVFTKPEVPKITFGTAVEKKSEPSSNAFTFGNSITPAAEKKVEPAPKPTGFAFGTSTAAPASTASPAFGGFAFGNTATTTAASVFGTSSTTTTTSAPATSTPTFGSVASPVTTSSTFSSPATTSPPSFAFNSTPAKTTTASQPVFGGSIFGNKPAVSSFTTTTSSAEQPAKVFGFGTTPAVTSTPSFSFTGSTPAPAAPAATNSPFVFGGSTFSNNANNNNSSNAPQQTPSPFQQQQQQQQQSTTPQTTTPVFGSSAGNAFPTPSFGGFTTPVAPTFGSTGSGSVFGSGGSSQSSEQVAKKANMGGFSFASSGGSSASSTGSGTSPFLFGGGAATPSSGENNNKPAFNFSPAVKPSFNFTSTEPQQGLGSNSIVPFQFGAANNVQAPPASGVFTFGNPVETQPPPPNPIFEFGAPNNNNAFPTGQTAGMAARRKIKATRRIQR